MRVSAKQFATEADIIRKNAMYLDKLKNLYRIGELFVGDPAATKSAYELLGPIFDTDTDLQSCYEGLLLRLTGSFESYIRNSVIHLIESISSENSGHGAVSEQLILRSRQVSGYALAKVFDPIDYHVIDYDELCVNLASSAPGSKKINFNSAAFAARVGPVTPDELEKLFSNLGRSLDWDAVASSAKIKGVVDQARTADATKAVKSKLREMIKFRNHYAHSGIGGPVIDMDLISEYSNLLIPLSEGLSDQFEAIANNKGR